MSTVQVTKRISQESPRVGSKFIGAYYLLTILTGAFLLFFHGKMAIAADLAVAVFYLAVTAFLYGLNAQGNKSVGR
jgi:hypoxanthine-guanine phosphoribosyltransferase